MEYIPAFAGGARNIQMKIYISVDMEGISGINSPEHVKRDGRLYAEGRRLLTDDVNAAVRGALEGGADEVIVADMHGGSNNLIIPEVDPRAMLLEGAPRSPRFAFLNKTVDGMVLLGYHAMNGTLEATLEHTMSSASWHKFTVNGTPWGELAIDATLAAEAGVPVIMVSGDDKLRTEARIFLGEAVEFACVKQGLGRQQALCMSAANGQKTVCEHMRRAVERLKNGEHFPLMKLEERYKIDLTYKFVPDADEAALQYGAKRIDGYTVETNYARLSDMYGGVWAERGIVQTVHNA